MSQINPPPYHLPPQSSSNTNSPINDSRNNMNPRYPSHPTSIPHPNQMRSTHKTITDIEKRISSIPAAYTASFQPNYICLWYTQIFDWAFTVDRTRIELHETRLSSRPSDRPCTPPKTHHSLQVHPIFMSLLTLQCEKKTNYKLISVNIIVHNREKHGQERVMSL